MTTLVAETGAGLSNANSYAGVTFADEYFANHPFYADAWDETDPYTKVSLLISATTMLDIQYLWHGVRKTTTQSLEWPRYRARDQYDTLIADDIVPLRVKQACCEQAYFLTKGDRAYDAQASTGLDKLKIDVIELDFSSSPSLGRTQPVSSAVRGLLRGLGDYVNGMRVRKVIVG